VTIAVLANVDDVEPWLELAMSLEPLFGPMPHFVENILRVSTEVPPGLPGAKVTLRVGCC